ncbi:MAG: VWA domain-containing protein [Candidatus Hydrogenedentes bacterium]|nr:VWA domain-containing protein [Candidatus Hydrogenedentota bacterium]
MSILEPLYFNTLKHPQVLLLLIGVALLFVAELTARPSGVLSISTGETLHQIRGRSKSLLRHLPAVLRAFALAFLVVALARPLSGMRPRVENAEVRDILLAVDVSGSMTSADFLENGKRRDRLYVTKAAVRHFIDNRKAKSTDRYGTDRVGLLLYASYAWIQTPLTLDYGLLEYDLDRVYIDQRDDKHNRTAIGDAIGLAVFNLNKSPAESKVIILLTDGINNYGSLDPITAAEIAKRYNMRVYTIGAGSPVRRSALGRDNPIDEDAMKRIASTTGGKYYRATDLQSLREAYDEINQLETTEIDLGKVYDYDEAFVPYAIVGTAAMLISVFTRRRWFEAIP